MSNTSIHYKCVLCGRSKFTKPGEPHKCVGGYRKRFKAAAKARGIPSCFIEVSTDGLTVIKMKADIRVIQRGKDRADRQVKLLKGQEIEVFLLGCSSEPSSPVLWRNKDGWEFTINKDVYDVIRGPERHEVVRVKPKAKVENAWSAKEFSAILEDERKRKIDESIALFMGWEKGPKQDQPCGPFRILAMSCWHKKEHKDAGWQDKHPKYTDSLDAMHQVEEAMSEAQYNAYCDVLWNMCRGASGKDGAIHASAMQRAEAFVTAMESMRSKKASPLDAWGPASWEDFQESMRMKYEQSHAAGCRRNV
jgi:hypothetical protein